MYHKINSVKVPFIEKKKVKYDKKKRKIHKVCKGNETMLRMNEKFIKKENDKKIKVSI